MAHWRSGSTDRLCRELVALLNEPEQAAASGSCRGNPGMSEGTH